jgi:aromatic-L-amino-acid decarboxylase
MFGAPEIRILSSTERHGSFERAVRLLGFGQAQVKLLPVDEQGRLVPEALEAELEKDTAAPTLVLLQAGDINIGAYDEFARLIPIAKRYAAWVHVDGAFGLWAGASPRFRHLVKGIETADSWATDGHKWLNVPFDSGFAFVSDPEAHRASLSIRASYLTHATDARDQVDWNPEWSRRARGFPAYAALRQLGRDGVAEMIERCCRHCHSLTMRIGSIPGAEVLWEPTINQGLVRFLAQTDTPSFSGGLPPAQAEVKESAPSFSGGLLPAEIEAANDRRTDEVIAAIQKTGEAFFGGTTWRGRRAMRISVTNWRTTDADVERVVNAVASALAGMHNSER